MELIFRLQRVAFFMVGLGVAGGSLAFMITGGATIAKSGDSHEIQSGALAVAHTLNVVDHLNGGFTVRANYLVGGRGYVGTFDIYGPGSMPPPSFEVRYVARNPSHAETNGYPRNDFGDGTLSVLIGVVLLGIVLFGVRSRTRRFFLGGRRLG
jgi:hypothetical protein